MPIPMLGSIAAGLTHNPLADFVIQDRDIQPSTLTDRHGRLTFSPADAQAIRAFVAGPRDERRSLSELAGSPVGQAYVRVAYDALGINPDATNDPDEQLINMATAGLAITIAVRLNVELKL